MAKKRQENTVFSKWPQGKKVPYGKRKQASAGTSTANHFVALHCKSE